MAHACILFNLISQAPSLLITLINMFLEIGSSPKVPFPGHPENTQNEYGVFGPTPLLASVQVCCFRYMYMHMHLE